MKLLGIKIKNKIKKWENSLIYDLKDYNKVLIEDCYWNKMALEEIKNLQNSL